MIVDLLCFAFISFFMSASTSISTSISTSTPTLKHTNDTIIVDEGVINKMSVVKKMRIEDIRIVDPERNPEARLKWWNELVAMNEKYKKRKEFIVNGSKWLIKSKRSHGLLHPIKSSKIP